MPSLPLAKPLLEHELLTVAKEALQKACELSAWVSPPLLNILSLTAGAADPWVEYAPTPGSKNLGSWVVGAHVLKTLRCQTSGHECSRLQRPQHIRGSKGPIGPAGIKVLPVQLDVVWADSGSCGVPGKYEMGICWGRQAGRQAGRQEDRQAGSRRWASRLMYAWASGLVGGQRDV